MNKTVKYHCDVCNQDFELPLGVAPVCPICGAGAEHLKVVEE